jgi:hypothetical protein
MGTQRKENNEERRLRGQQELVPERYAGMVTSNLALQTINIAEAGYLTSLSPPFPCSSSSA